MPLIGWRKFSANQKHYLDQGSYPLSVGNFCGHFSGVISRGNHWCGFARCRLFSQKYKQLISPHNFAGSANIEVLRIQEIMKTSDSGQNLWVERDISTFISASSSIVWFSFKPYPPYTDGQMRSRTPLLFNIRPQALVLRSSDPRATNEKVQLYKLTRRDKSFTARSLRVPSVYCDWSTLGQCRDEQCLITPVFVPVVRLT